MNNIIFLKIIATIFLFNIFGCSILNHFVYQPNIIQGNYLNTNDLKKINIGMKKEIIFSILGTPILHDPFGSNTYYYIFYKKSHYGKISQKTITLKFNNNDILISINYKTS